MTATTYSLEALQAFPAQRLIVVIHGGVYDLSEFQNIHPGGMEILKRFNRRDASQAFDKIHHSRTAMSMLPKYCIGHLTGQEALHRQHIQKLSGHSNTPPLTPLRKLITHEDHFHIHKILGSLVLGHFLVRMMILLLGTALFLGTGDNTVFHWNTQLDPAWLLIGMALVHGLLSLSALQFEVPQRSSQSKPMIHALFRAHSINFALRAVACMLLAVLLKDHQALRYLAISLVILLTFIIADIITTKLSDPSDRFDTTASMPYWFGVSPRRQNIHKYFYGYAQFLASFVCLTAGYAGALYTLAPIQGAAFGMTLVRKNLISPKLYHNIYFALLFLPIPFAFILFPIRVSFGLLFTLFLFHLRVLGVNKYLLWLPVLMAYNILLIPKPYWGVYLSSLTLVFLLAVLLNLIYLRKYPQQRIDKNHRIIARKKISDSCFELVIRSKHPMTLKPGQHVLIRLDDGLERKYTPIKTEQIPDTQQTLIYLRIKRYPGKPRYSASRFLYECDIGTVLDMHAPTGSKYYDSNKDAIIDELNHQEEKLNNKNIVLFAAGSGITPMYTLAEAMLENGKHIELISCDTTKQSMMMEKELSRLKERYQEKLNWHCLLTKGGKEVAAADTQLFKILDETLVGKIIEQRAHQENIVIMCGPESWQTMIQSALALNGQKKHTAIVW